jgi:hypothetical protein
LSLKLRGPDRRGMVNDPGKPGLNPDRPLSGRVDIDMLRNENVPAGADVRRDVEALGRTIREKIFDWSRRIG